MLSRTCYNATRMLGSVCVCFYFFPSHLTSLFGKTIVFIQSFLADIRKTHLKVDENKLHHQVRCLLSLSLRLGSAGISYIPLPYSAGNPSTTAVTGTSGLYYRRTYPNLWLFVCLFVCINRQVSIEIWKRVVFSPSDHTSVFLP